MHMPSLASVLTPAELKGVRALGAEDLEGLLRIVPNRYVIPGALRALQDVHEGEDVSAVVHVVSARDRRMRSRAGSILEVTVTDGTDRLVLTFFLQRDHLVQWHRSRLRPGERIVVFGTVKHAPGPARAERGELPQIAHPRYEIVGEDDALLREAMRPIPVYPLRRSTKQSTMRSALASALPHASEAVSAIPAAVLAAQGLPALEQALHLIHAPRTADDIPAGLSHLVFEEAFVLQAIFAQRRALDARTPAPALEGAGPLQPMLEERLPLTLTGAQRTVREAILERIGRDHPANLLLQGDVGSGKTIVALLAMIRAVDSGHQAALLAPTEVLAEQHFRTITALMGDLSRAGRLDGHPQATAVRLLTGSQRTAQRRETLLDVTSGTAGIVVGTHALLSDPVEFAALGLVVIDEQHRFGVDHRRRLRSKGPAGGSPHVIVMSATPIPRTAALATLGDLDILTLDESPSGRTPITSFAVPEENQAWEQRMWSRVGEEIAEGRQAFVVCARIEESEEAPPSTLELDGLSPPETAGAGDAAGEIAPRGVEETARRLAARPELAGARIGVLHGRMSSEDKQLVMGEMVEGRLDLLVATTVIEVGVDVPNATAMVVLDAERFGVSQLHQLRGRVGRGEHPGIAFFATRAPRGSAVLPHLQEIAGTTDGFALAELDLRRRGSGDLVGEVQSGLGRTLRFLDVLRDAEAIARAREAAFAVVAADPELEREPALREAIAHRLRDADPRVERS